MSKQTKLSEVQIKILTGRLSNYRKFGKDTRHMLVESALDRRACAGLAARTPALLRPYWTVGDTPSYEITPEGEKVRAELLAAAQTEVQSPLESVVNAINNGLQEVAKVTLERIETQPSAAPAAPSRETMTVASCYKMLRSDKQFEADVQSGAIIVYVAGGQRRVVNILLGKMLTMYTLIYAPEGQHNFNTAPAQGNWTVTLERIMSAQPPAEGVLFADMPDNARETAAMDAQLANEEIARLQLENVALREALQWIAKYHDSGKHVIKGVATRGLEKADSVSAEKKG